MNRAMTSISSEEKEEEESDSSWRTGPSSSGLDCGVSSECSAGNDESSVTSVSLEDLVKGLDAEFSGLVCHVFVQ